MFSYYGSKSKIVHLYPKPEHWLIIEPFAGSARYALRWWDRDVIINDLNPDVIRLWRFLQRSSPSDIMSLPNLKAGDDLRYYKFDDDDALLLMRFLTRQGSKSPNWKVTSRSDIASEKRRIANNLKKIKHWKIISVDYSEIPNYEATWFIDPPYQFGGKYYKVKLTDYDALAKWCLERKGQIIVCESSRADWLPFVPLVKIRGNTRSYTEAIYTNNNLAAPGEQGLLF